MGLKPRWSGSDRAVGDESLADGARGRRLAPRARHVSRLESHAHDPALVPRGHGSRRRHQRVSVDGRGPRAARAVRSQHRQPDGQLRPEGHADDHGSAVPDRVRAPGQRRHPAQARGVRPHAIHIYEPRRDARAYGAGRRSATRSAGGMGQVSSSLRRASAGRSSVSSEFARAPTSRSSSASRRRPTAAGSTTR